MERSSTSNIKLRAKALFDGIVHCEYGRSVFFARLRRPWSGPASMQVHKRFQGRGLWKMIFAKYAKYALVDFEQKDFKYGQK